MDAWRRRLSATEGPLLRKQGRENKIRNRNFLFQSIKFINFLNFFCKKFHEQAKQTVDLA